MKASETAKALGEIEWLAEDGLSGFRTLSVPGAAESARLALESILDVLHALNNADRVAVEPSSGIEPTVGDEANVLHLNAGQRLNRESLGSELRVGAQHRDSDHDKPVFRQFEKGVGREQHLPAVYGGDNVLPLFDRLADRVARDRLRRDASIVHPDAET